MSTTLRKPSTYPPIEDLFAFGNCKYYGVMDRKGSICWFGDLARRSLLCSLLDANRGGFWRIEVAGATDLVPWEEEQNGVVTMPGPGIATKNLWRANVVATEHRTRRGTLRTTTFSPMQVRVGQNSLPALIRRLECTRGRVEVTVTLKVTPGNANPDIPTAQDSVPVNGQLLIPGEKLPSGEQEYIGLVTSTGKLLLEEMTFRRRWLPRHRHATYQFTFTLTEGESLSLSMFVGTRKEVNRLMARTQQADPSEQLLTDTLSYWNLDMQRYPYHGPGRENVRRAVLAALLLWYQETGALAAAGTDSLPETLGGVRNWPYRYCWPRDGSMGAEALLEMGLIDEAEGFLRWLVNRGPVAGWKILYSLAEGGDTTERILYWLSGYAGSSPAREGNAAANQKQLDVYGEVGSFLHGFIATRGYRQDAAALLWEIADHVCEHFCDPDDAGIWEIRAGGQTFTYSQGACWGALNWAIKIADQVGTKETSNGVRDLTENIERWRATRDEIAHEFNSRGYNEQLQSFTQTYNGSALDASLLLLHRYGIVKPDDPRFQNTVRRIREELVNEAGFVLRYRIGAGADDGLVGEEGSFVACHFWLIEAMAECGMLDEAIAEFERMRRLIGPSGGIAEMMLADGTQLGNYVQLYSLISLIKAALAIGRALERRRASEATPAESA